MHTFLQLEGPLSHHPVRAGLGFLLRFFSGGGEEHLIQSLKDPLCALPMAI